MKKEKIIRKPDPTIGRRNIHVATLNKVKAFLQEQIAPIYKSEITRNMSIDYNSLKFALAMLNIGQDKEGRIYLKSNKKIKGRLE